ncbi:MAG: hypothetical protein Q9217_003341 [Psora testacea]
MASLVPLAMAHPQEIRVPLLQVLLENGASGAHVNEALVTAVSEGVKAKPTIDLLLEDGKSVIIATQQLNNRSLYLLFRSKTKPTSQNCSLAFSIMPHDPDRWQNEPQLVHEFDKILISGGAAGPAVDHTFLSAIRSSHALAAQFISLVLSCRTALSVNYEGGRSLCIATRRARFDVVDYLLLQRSNEPILRNAFMSIFESGAEEQVLITMARRYFAHSSGAKHIYFPQDEPMNDALYQTLHRHGDKPGLLKELFNNGCSSESRFPWRFNDSHGFEQTSGLLWLICQGNEGIDIRIVNMLLEQGGK